MTARIAKPYWVKLGNEDWSRLPRSAQEELIKNRPPEMSPDAPEAQPEPAVSQKAQALLVRIRQETEEARAIQQLWMSVFPDFEVPDTRQCRVWLKCYGFDTAVAGIEAALVKHNKKLQPSDEPEQHSWQQQDVVRYASGCMKNIRRKTEEGA